MLKGSFFKEMGVISTDSSCSSLPPIKKIIIYYGNYVDRYKSFLFKMPCMSASHFLIIGNNNSSPANIVELFPSPPHNWESLYLSHVTSSCLVDGEIFMTYSNLIHKFICSHQPSTPPPYNKFMLTINKVLFQSCNFQYGGYAL